MRVYDSETGRVWARMDEDETKIAPETNFAKDLGADSLHLVELVMAIEERVGTETPAEDAEKLFTIQDTNAYLRRRRAAIEP